uniref:Uncharacterized protein n=1 Tax=Rhizophora mucronata TaxID=61149 RepID=A0A2P2N7L1_RHIMU
MIIPHHCTPVIPEAKPILICYLSHLKMISRSGHIGMALPLGLKKALTRTAPG